MKILEVLESAALYDTLMVKIQEKDRLNLAPDLFNVHGGVGSHDTLCSAPESKFHSLVCHSLPNSFLSTDQ